VSLTHEDVQRILELLDRSQFDELHLETGGLKLTLRRGGQATNGPTSASPGAANETAAAPPAREASPDHTVIRAPLLGTFYRAPKPGADPFVAVGTQVDHDTVVGIIEVMKLMNSVAAGVRGRIVEIFAGDGQFVEYGQVLMRVKPD
jgi:acetyl-CoA carboxylase biotin carboxyl carrier protein